MKTARRRCLNTFSSMKSFRCSVHHVLIQGYLGAAVSSGEGLHLRAQTPGAPALRGDLLRELRPRHHHHALLRLRDRDQAGQPVHLQQHREVHYITQNSLVQYRMSRAQLHCVFKLLQASTIMFPFSNVWGEV